MFAPLSWIAVTALACIFCSRASSSSGVSSVCSRESPCRAASDAGAAGRSYDGSMPSAMAAARICSSRCARAARAASRRSRSVCGCWQLDAGRRRGDGRVGGASVARRAHEGPRHGVGDRRGGVARLDRREAIGAVRDQRVEDERRHLVDDAQRARSRMRVVEQRIARAEIQQAHAHPLEQPSRRCVAKRGFDFHRADTMQSEQLRATSARGKVSRQAHSASRQSCRALWHLECTTRGSANALYTVRRDTWSRPPRATSSANAWTTARQADSRRMSWIRER